MYVEQTKWKKWNDKTHTLDKPWQVHFLAVSNQQTGLRKAAAGPGGSQTDQQRRSPAGCQQVRWKLAVQGQGSGPWTTGRPFAALAAAAAAGQLPWLPLATGEARPGPSQRDVMRLSNFQPATTKIHTNACLRWYSYTREINHKQLCAPDLQRTGVTQTAGMAQVDCLMIHRLRERAVYVQTCCFGACTETLKARACTCVNGRPAGHHATRGPCWQYKNKKKERKENKARHYQLETNIPSSSFPVAAGRTRKKTATELFWPWRTKNRRSGYEWRWVR